MTLKDGISGSYKSSSNTLNVKSKDLIIRFLLRGFLRRFHLARNAEISGLPINEAIAFSNKGGEFKEGIRKKQLSMLKDFEALLKQFLEPGEEILLAMRGCSPMTVLEQLTMGWSASYLKRCTFVVTNRRILHFPSTTDYKPRHSISQIRFGDVEEIKPSTFFGRFTVVYKDGKKEIFNYVKEMAKLKAILKSLIRFKRLDNFSVMQD